jgi:hypothetical protein
MNGNRLNSRLKLRKNDKLKLDTELAMQAQKIELAKMEHMWEVDKMDKQASADNAKNWLNMIQTFGSNFVEKVGPAIVDGFANKGKRDGTAHSTYKRQN